MREKSESIFYNVDWFTVAIYAILVTIGWFNIYSAVYDEAKSNIFDFSRIESKQLVFIGVSVIIAVSILIIDASFFTATAYILYAGVLLLNLAVVVLGTDIRGSKSWFKIGGFGFQPAEFAKWATLLALAKFISGVDRVNFRRTFYMASLIICLPIAIIAVLQNETGVALVFFGFIFVLYREGIFPGWLLMAGIASAASAVIGIKYGAIVIPDVIPPKGVSVHYTIDMKALLFWLGSLAAAGVIYLLAVRRTFLNMLIVIGFIAGLTGVYLAAPIVLEKIPEHQSGRIKTWLSLPVSKEISDRFDYNTRQSMIAIGSGGVNGKGYLQGTQTKFRFVPEQETDFIFCTVGEEWGFMGTAGVVLLYLVLILRLIILSERQRSDFTRIYGYG
ncbi:MAG TPA: rod shape-determining protein RodA, partial [Bacteroidia bacterium]|nr:rod shape-determining protein RodA [Bacteroidia bacterium]